MGTNYFVIRKIDEEEYREIRKTMIVSSFDAITVSSFDPNINDKMSKFCKVHIGKSSGGWQFLFNHNDCKYYQKNRESINEFIKYHINHGGMFIDEYGEKVNLDEFWEMVDKKKDGLDALKSYQQDMDDYNFFYTYGQEEYIKSSPQRATMFKFFGPPRYPSSWALNSDFPENGLRFSSSTEFS